MQFTNLGIFYLGNLLYNVIEISISLKVVDKMSASYEEKFNVLEVFEENSYQKIIMGTKKNNPEDVVVINIFKKSELLNSKFVSDLFSSLRFLAFFEETESEISIATDYYEGMSLINYIEDNNLSYDHRKKIALEYLDGLKNYEYFDPYFLKLFSQEKQLIISNEELKFTEIIVVDDSIKNEHTFDSAAETIGNTLDKIIFFKLDSTLSDSRLMDYIHSLISKTSGENSITEIESSLKGLFDSTSEVVKEKKADGEKKENINKREIVPPVAPIVSNAESETYEATQSVKEEPKTENKPSFHKPDKSLEEVKDEKDEDADEIQSKVSGVEDIIIEETPIDELLEKNTDKVVELENVTYSSPELDEMLSNDSNDENQGKKSSGKIMWLFLIALLAIIGIFGKFVFFKTPEQPPVASFEKIKEYEKILFKNTSKAFGNDNEIVLAEWTVTSNGNELLKTTDNYDLELKFKNSDTYKVTLKVQDKNGLWSESYFEEFDYEIDTLGSIDETGDKEENEVNEKLNKYTITLGENSKFSEDVKRSGTKSIELDLASNNGEGEISLDGIFLDNQYIISLWIMADSNEPIKLEFTGYNDGTIKFVKSTTHNPTSGNVWDMVEVGGGNNLIDKLHIKVTSKNRTVWIDDIELNSYK